MNSPINKIVIVDDEAHIRSLLQQTLEELEGSPPILTAPNGAMGLALIEKEHPRLVFLDVMMPLMNGYDVCAAVRKNPALADVTIVMLTAKGQEADRIHGLDVGAHHFVTKPFDPDEILELARSVFDAA
ncbi:response regulator transcription factor [Candidatus Symbiobacter mobilis]|uniref:CheY-like chemotaxis protein n=1 Tax=Candidatus Symbiobacter mobilis CR TaxID=946483 RepID=U5N9V8_9BURK|nr:response regulator [Candidatus Symbiobacter mobilis]AGX88105.1 CheY-like chemotaxis protein [Candidatus Symbiobacter mobilis CR]